MLWTRILFLSILSFSDAARFGSSGRLFAAVTPRRAPVTVTATALAKSKSTDDILKLRGGAGPLDPSIVVKTASVIAGIQGLMLQFAPVDCAIFYGLDEEVSRKPMNALATTYHGTGILTWAATTGYLCFVDNATAKGAFTVAVHIWIYENLRNMLGKTTEKAGGSSIGMKINLPIQLLGLYGMTQTYADTVLKILGVFFSLSGLHYILDPAGASKLWLKYEEFDDIGKCWMQGIGHGILAQSLVFVAMSFLDYDGLRAVGLGSVSWFLMHVYGILSGRDDKLGIPRNPMLFWLAYNAVVIYATLF